MPDLVLSDGVRVTVRGPLPRIRMGAPTPGRVTVLPVRGPAGPPGGAGTFPHHQINPAATWIIHHQLNTRAVPMVLLDDNPTRPVYPDVDVTDADTVTLTFPTPVTGWAYLNN